MELCEGSKVMIHCYKHDGSIHKSWKYAYVLDITDDMIVLGNENVSVMKQNGSVWRTKEPAIMFFFKDKWYNVIAQLKNNGLYYYCNVASPFVIDDDVVKYIDYDLDLRVFDDGSFKILDKNEYKYHKKLMSYSNELDVIIRNALDKLIELKKKNEFPFDYNAVEHYYEIFKKYQK